MVEIFASSLINGFMQSSMMGKGIVLIQLATSVVMLAAVFSKWKSLAAAGMMTRRIGRDVMGGREVLDYYTARHDSTHSAIENIYIATCERLLKLFTPDVRTMLVGRQPGASSLAALTANEVGLVKALCEHVLEEEEIRLEKGMGLISTVVALAPMLGLLGTVWGVLDAFADMGAAGTATIATMAPAISSALVTTVVGLLIAIPGVALHSNLSSKLRDLMSDLEGFADDLMGRIALEFQGRSA